ncbi:MAG: Hsp20/alpha crystallin family protein [Bryobacteraceae bacterium]|jgi:HSP20 family protein
MSEVKVEKNKSLARREMPGLSPFNDFFTPAFPVGRFFGLSPFAMMREFSEEMERLYRANGAALEAWTPTVDIQRSNGDLLVTAELPGLKKEEVKVEVTDDALIIEGERKREHKVEEEGYHRYERSFGKFYRFIPLPEGAKPDQAKAELTDGVLKISVPAPEVKKKVRQIAVEEGAEKKPVAA